MAGESPVKSFSCTACNAPVPIRGMGQTTTVACGSCGAIIDISNENYRVIHSSQRIREPFIALGTRGKIRDIEYEIIGYLVRSDATGMYDWEEYLLFNPYEGFAWLMNYEGHWTYLTPIKDSLQIEQGHGGTSHVDYHGQSFRLFLSGYARVQFVLGEFYWEVKVGDDVGVKDFISPPYILSMERTFEETVWSFGEYLSPDEVAAAFRVRGSMPYREGVGAAQPHPAHAWSREFKLIGILFIVVVLSVQILFSRSAGNVLVYERNYYYSASESVRTVVTEPFDVPRKGNLSVRASAPVSNNWMALDMDLVNESGQEIQGAELEVGYYHGRDSDGAWTEGSQANSLLFGALPKGVYRLSFEPSVGPGIGQIPYSIKVVSDVNYLGNFWFVFLTISVPLALLFLWERSFEARRWQEADP